MTERRSTRPILAAALLLAACRSSDPFDKEATWPTPARGAVVSEHPLATRIGVDVLVRGGNAADAAVATALALAVVHPQAGNLGGGGFAIFVPHSAEPEALDFRETAPRAARTELYLDESGQRVPARSLSGPIASGVPGSPAGLCEIHRRWGSKRFTLAALAEPAIRLAREGFAVDAELADDLAEPGLRERMNDAARAVFYPGGRALAEGELLRQPALARTLELLATQGPRGFYQGPVAQAIVRTLEDERGGEPWIDLQDLADYRAIPREPLRGWFRGMEFVTMPPPSSGGIALLQILAIFEGLPLDAERDRALVASSIGGETAGVRPDPAISARLVHWLIEALRRAFADRAEHLGDPAFHDVPVEELLSPAWTAERRVSIGDRADPSVGPWEPLLEENLETTHLSVLDRRGNAVSLTTTINDSFGSGSLVDGAGFLLNDEIDDFAITPDSPNLFGLTGGEANALGPARRPLSSMAPTVVRDGGHSVTLVLGSRGGSRIITSVLQVVLRLFALGQPLDKAVSAPRLHQQWKPPGTDFEHGWDPELLGALRNRHGQVATVVDRKFGSVQAIHVAHPGDVPSAISDPRSHGLALVEPKPERD